MSKALQVHPSFVLKFNTEFNEIKKSSKGTILEQFFTDNSPVSYDMSVIMAVNDFIQKNSLDGLADVFVCEKIEGMIQGGVHPFEAMEFGKILGNNDKLTLFFEMIKASTMQLIATADEGKTLRLFLFGMSKMKLLSPSVLNIVKKMYFEPLRLPCSSKIKKPKNELSVLLNYRLGDMENSLDQLKKKLGEMEMKVNYVPVQTTNVSETNENYAKPEEVKKVTHDCKKIENKSDNEPFVLVSKNDKTYIKMIEGELSGMIYSVKCSDDDLAIEIKENQLFVKNSLGNELEVTKIDDNQQIDLLWEIIDTIFTKVSEDIRCDSNFSEIDENWTTFDQLLSQQ